MPQEIFQKCPIYHELRIISNSLNNVSKLTHKNSTKTIIRLRLSKYSRQYLLRFSGNKCYKYFKVYAQKITSSNLRIMSTRYKYISLILFRSPH